MIYHLLWIFFIYSFGGWALECLYAAFRKRAFINRGVLGGPFCCIYGAAAVLDAHFLPELSETAVFLFLGGAFLFEACEWISAKLLERIYHRRFWNYADHKYHIDGYVSLPTAALGGAFALVAVKWLNQFFLSLIDMIPQDLGRIILIVAIALMLIDAAWTYCFLLGLPQRFPKTEKIENTILRATARLNEWIVAHAERRILRAYPATGTRTERVRTERFAEGCCATKLFWLLVLGAFLGDITETIFCRITAGVWMSRSSLVFGPFSIVWGIGIAGATWFLYHYRDRSDTFLFLYGTFLGGAFEYLCSVFTEHVFGQVFWDYSSFRYNLNGRINLLYCFFWGIAAVVWLKLLYPRVSARIELVPVRAGQLVTAIVLVYFLLDISLTSAALIRYHERSLGIPAQNAAMEWVDTHYDDARMKQRFPNGILKG